MPDVFGSCRDTLVHKQLLKSRVVQAKIDEIRMALASLMRQQKNHAWSMLASQQRSDGLPRVIVDAPCVQEASRPIAVIDRTIEVHAKDQGLTGKVDGI